MHIESGEPGLEAEQRADLVVHAGVVGAIGDVEAFRGQNQTGALADLVLPGQSRVEVNIVGAETGVARITYGAFISDVIVAIDRATCEQIERMTAVVLENW